MNGGDMAQDVERIDPVPVVDPSDRATPQPGAPPLPDPATLPRAAGSLLDILSTSFGPGQWSLTRMATDDLEVVLASTGETAEHSAADARHVPITLPDGTRFGTMSVPQHIAELWDPLFGELGRLVAMLSDAQHATRDQADRADRAERHARRAERSALIDRMTGLGNRAAWEHMLELAHARAERYHEPAVVIVVDLDDLKTINDRDGHLAGDFTIRITAEALTRSTRRPDWVARLGGDEFGIIAQPCTEHHAALLVERIHDTLLEEQIRASVGQAAHDPSRPILETWQLADADMYAVKSRHKAGR
jgi:diguanylate cyclase (GGDEF)-like protein